MRADLHTMEKIDQFLTGKLSGSELSQFKSEMAANPELQNLVNDQQLLIQTVNRKALLAEIHLVAGVGGAAPWYANPWIAGTGAIIVAGTIAATIYYSTTEPENPQNILALTEQELTDSTTTETINYNDLAYIDSSSSVDQSTSKHVRITDGSNYPSPDPAVCDNSELADNQTLNFDGPDNNDTKGETQVSDTDLKNRNRKASYPKGDIAMNEFIDKYMRFPGTAKEKKLSGNVKVKFLVTDDGQRTTLEAKCFAMRDEYDKPLSNAQFVFNQKIANLFERESERIVRIMPLWIPATDSAGNPVLTPVEIYFNFSLKDGISVYRLDE